MTGVFGEMHVEAGCAEVLKPQPNGRVFSFQRTNQVLGQFGFANVQAALQNRRLPYFVDRSRGPSTKFTPVKGLKLRGRPEESLF